MKFFGVISLALIAAVSAAPRSVGSDAQITSYSADVGAEGYNFAVATSDGKAHQEAGQLQGSGENEAMKVSGQFQYVGPDGVTYTVNYIADENGFQPQGAHIPKP